MCFSLYLFKLLLPVCKLASSTEDTLHFKSCMYSVILFVIINTVVYLIVPVCKQKYFIIEVRLSIGVLIFYVSSNRSTMKALHIFWHISLKIDLKSYFFSALVLKKLCASVWWTLTKINSDFFFAKEKLSEKLERNMYIFH